MVVDDEMMSFLWETATQIDARNRIDEHGVVADGALWYEESLPPESVLIGAVGAERSRSRNRSMGEVDVLREGLGKAEIIQLGGKATVGRGVCRLLVEMGEQR